MPHLLGVKAYVYLVRALEEDTRVFSFYFSSSPLGQTAVSLGISPFIMTLGIFVFFLIFCESLTHIHIHILT